MVGLMVSVSLSCTPASGPSNTSVVLKYTVTGADDEPASSTSQHIDGTTVVDGTTYEADVDVTLTKPAVIHTRLFNAPSGAVLKNVVRDSVDPSKFTAQFV
jgi:hypothetical protein